MLALIVIAVNPAHPRNAESSMVVTLSGIDIHVNREQFSNAYAPMLVTGQPPNVVGIERVPSVEVGTAREPYQEPLPTDARPLDKVYVHSIPSTTSESEKEERGKSSAARAKSWIVRFMGRRLRVERDHPREKTTCGERERMRMRPTGPTAGPGCRRSAVGSRRAVGFIVAGCVGKALPSRFVRGPGKPDQEARRKDVLAHAPACLPS